MEGSGHHERIIQLGKSLIGENIIVDTVRFELERYKGRRNKLMEPVSNCYLSVIKTFQSHIQFDFVLGKKPTTIFRSWR